MPAELSAPERVRICATDLSRDGRDGYRMLTGYVFDEERTALLEQMREMHGAICRELPDQSVSVQDLVTTRVQATVLADHFLMQALKCKGGLDSVKGIESVRLSIHLRTQAMKAASAAREEARAMLEWRKARESGEDGRAVFSTEGT